MECDESVVIFCKIFQHKTYFHVQCEATKLRVTQCDTNHPSLGGAII